MDSHPRFKIFNDYNKKEYPFIIFKKDEKLRSHTVKHVLHWYEWNTGWKRLMKDVSPQKSENHDIFKVYDTLKGIGCPYVSEKVDPESLVKMIREQSYKGGYPAESEDDRHPPCGGCRLYRQCSSTGIVEVQELYVSFVQKGIEKSLQTPRYAQFIPYNKNDGEKRLTGLIVGPVIIRTAFVSDLQYSYYNVMTAFVPVQYRRWVDVIMSETEKIKDDARTSPVDWHIEDTWSINSPASNDTKNEPTGKKGKSVYNKRSKTNWKTWLDF
jgi:hypothetical protein